MWDVSQNFCLDLLHIERQNKLVQLSHLVISSVEVGHQKATSQEEDHRSRYGYFPVVDVEAVFDSLPWRLAFKASQSLGAASSPRRAIERMIQQVGASIGFQMRITNGAAGVVLAQFMVACAFAVRTMRNTFDQISPRQEEVAMTLGSSRGEAFWNIVLP